MHFTHTSKGSQCSHPRGLTLVELIVTLAIFGAVTTVLLGSFLALFSVREQTNVTQQANDDVRTVLDSIEREIQTGNNVVASGESISFVVSARGTQPPYPVQYRRNGTAIEKAIGRDVAGDPCDYDPATMAFENVDGCWLPITGSNVEVSVLSFGVVEAETEDEQTSPLVTVGLAGSVKDSAGNATPLTYSTSIMPRNRITVSDVAAAPVSPAPITSFVDIDPVSSGGNTCRVSKQHYLPIDTTAPFPDWATELYTDCTTVDLGFEVTLPGEAGFHSLRYTAGTINRVHFGSGETGTVGVSFTGPTSLSPLPLGTTTVTVVAEDLYGNTVANSFKIERVASFTPPPPDLTPTTQPVLASGSLVQGSDVTFRATTQNIGGSSTGAPFSTNFTYCWGAGCSDWTMLGGHISQVELAAGASAPQDMSANLTLSITVTTSETLRVRYCTDSQSAIAESDETNNCTRRNFTVVAASPQLIVCPTAGTSVTVGSSITLQARYWPDLASVPDCTTAGYSDVSGSAAWSSSDPGQASVVGGVVTGVSTANNTLITATYLGLSDSLGVTVHAAGSTQCSDGTDNADPEDTLIDLADPGCENAADDDETDPVCTTYEWTYTYLASASSIIDDNTLMFMSLPACQAAVAAGPIPGVYQYTTTYNCGCAGGMNEWPTADAGGYRTITLPTTSVVISGASASDPDGSGDIVATQWSFVSGPGPTPTITDATTLTPTFGGMALPGVYTFRLTVTDRRGVNAQDTMVVNVVPSAPTLLGAATHAMCGSGRIDVFWGAVAGATSYEISIDGAAYVSVGAATSYTHLGLVPGSAHSFMVRARSGTLVSAGAGPVSATAPEVCFAPPSTPLGLNPVTGSCGTGIITISWGLVTDATSYRLFANTVEIYNGPSNAFVHSGLPNGLPVSYVVRAVNAFGESVDSAPVTGYAPTTCMYVWDSGVFVGFDPWPSASPCGAAYWVESSCGSVGGTACSTLGEKAVCAECSGGCDGAGVSYSCIEFTCIPQ